jgi:hypothetical protein
MCRYALHAQAQSSHVGTRRRAMACRALTLALPSGAGLGYRPTDLHVSPATDRARGFLPGPQRPGFYPRRNPMITDMAVTALNQTGCL